jgi:hypothetical protein
LTNGSITAAIFFCCERGSFVACSMSLRILPSGLPLRFFRAGSSPIGSSPGDERFDLTKKRQAADGRGDALKVVP